MTDEPTAFSAMCSTCNVGATSDARGVARWATEHVGQREHRQTLERTLSSGLEVGWASLEAGEHCVTIRRLVHGAPGVIVFRTDGSI